MTSDENYRLGLWAAVTVVIGFMALFLSVAPANAQISMFEWAQDQQERYDAGLPQRSLEQFEADEEPKRPATPMVHYGTNDKTEAVIGTKEMDYLINEGYTPESGKFVTEDAVRATEPVREQLVIAESEEKVAKVVEHFHDIVKEATEPMGVLERLFAPVSPEIHDEVMKVVNGGKPSLVTGQQWTDREESMREQIVTTTEELQDKWQVRELEINDVLEQGKAQGITIANRSNASKTRAFILLAGVLFIAVAWYRSRNPYRYMQLKSQAATLATYAIMLAVIIKFVK